MSTQKTSALVTGGSRGIGAAIAETLAQQGFHVYVNYVANEARAIEVVNRIIEKGGTAEPLRFDVGNETEMVAAFERVAKGAYPLEVLVNNAGISEDGLILRLKKDSLMRTLETDLAGAILCGREAAKQMMKRRTGTIINMSSVVGEMGNAGQVAYGAAKAGLIGFTKSMAKELASRSIRVNAITPGYIRTDMTNALNETQQKALSDNIPLSRLGEAQDVADLVSFLASTKSSYITGQVIGINGGLYI